MKILLKNASVSFIIELQVKRFQKREEDKYVRKVHYDNRSRNDELTSSSLQ